MYRILLFFFFATLSSNLSYPALDRVSGVNKKKNVNTTTTETISTKPWFTWGRLNPLGWGGFVSLDALLHRSRSAGIPARKTRRNIKSSCALHDRPTVRPERIYGFPRGLSAQLHL